MLDLRQLCRDMSDPKPPLRREAEDCTGRIAACLERPSPRTAELLAGWREDFRLIYGEASLSAHKRLDPEALLRSYGLDPRPEEEREARMQVLVFAIQTYYSLLVKFAMAAILGYNLRDWTGVIDGSFARRQGIVNYCVEDWYCWPLYELNAGMGRVLEITAEQVSRYSPDGPGGTVQADRDDLKRLYEALIPAPLRHALGEYYTPDWLAAYTLEKGLSLSGRDIRQLRIADPACGSGTFLMQAIAGKRRAGCGLGSILQTVRGYDINPLAVLTAKTNYLLAVLDLLDGPLELPVCQADALSFAADTAKADLVAGNPPWVNWEYLPAAYRAKSQHLWSKYGLVSAKGPVLSFLKEDISVLMTCTAADRLLETGGTLALVLRQGIFKSARNGAGFRRFRLPDGTGLRVLRVEDLSRLKVFLGASAGAALFFAKKGSDTAYPIPYARWEKLGRGPVDPRSSLPQALARVEVHEQQASPASPSDPASPWLTAPAEELAGLERMLGGNPYRARTGVFTGGANAVYWLSVRSAEDGLVRAANVLARAKRKAEQVEAEIETDYLYPMLKGGSIRRWRTKYDTYILCPHTAETKLRPVPWEQLAADCPRTAAYLASFRETLDQRKGFAGWERVIQRQEFHAVLRVGAYTFAPWKVVWKYIASEFVCAVVGTVDDPYLGRKLLLPNEKVMYVSTDCEEEAYYLCGVLSSTPASRCVRGYMNPTSISAHVLEKLRIPAYAPADPIHREISSLCRAGHGEEDPERCISEIDLLMEKLYGK
ncbi:MAG: N-6 DNA methylase [Oscillospiraceae bacterium]|nr:N-6 DNA methylase [Oscillospiraceae bacterium]